ncbi:MAG: hypothetical protein RMI94_12975 [Bryobacterales bacterium]|nr:hypothetical protein [Bryobacterales bacterium]
MERRHEVRFPAGRLARVRLLQDPRESFEVLISEASGPGLRLITARPIPVGSAIEIEEGELTLLGEVCHCCAAADSYTADVRVEHRLTLTEDLLRLARQLRLEQGAPAEAQTD